MRRSIELNRYFEKLLEEAMTEELREIEYRLVRIGKDRYLR